MDAETCGLAGGDYLVKLRDELSDSSFFLTYALEPAALLTESLQNKVPIRIEDSFVWIHSKTQENFAIVNSLGLDCYQGNRFGKHKNKAPFNRKLLDKSRDENVLRTNETITLRD